VGVKTLLNTIQYNYKFCYLASFWEYRLDNLRAFSVSQLQAQECFQVFTNSVFFVSHSVFAVNNTIAGPVAVVNIVNPALMETVLIYSVFR